jgi:hypothetical protein
MHRGEGAGRNGSAGRVALAFVAFAWVCAFAWIPGDGFWINDNGLKFIQIDGLVRSDFGTLAIEWPGRRADPELAFGPLTQGFLHMAGDDLYAAYSPVFALLTAPLYAVFGTVGLYVLPLAGFLLTLFAVRALAAATAPPALAGQAQVLAVLSAGLATPLWFYGLTLWEHAPSVACACFSVLACVRFRAEPHARHAVATGAAAALACWLRTDAYVLAAIVLATAWWGGRSRLRDAALLGGAFAAVMAPVWLLHTVAFGNPLGPHVASQAAEVDASAFLVSRIATSSNALLRGHASTWWSVLAVAPFALALLMRPVLAGARLRVATPLFALAGTFAGLIVLGGHVTAARPMTWLMVSNGLFASAPLCVLALLRVGVRDGGASEAGADGIVADAPSRARESVLFLVLVYAALLALASPEVNSRGIHWGNRFLLPAYPLLAVLASVTAVAWWARVGAGHVVAKGALCSLLLVSLALQLHALRMLHDRKAFTRLLNERVAASEREAVVVDTWHLPVDLARTFHEKSIFFVHRGERGAFRALAGRAGIERALSIERRLGDGTGGGAGDGEEVLSDGWLRFSPVVLRDVRLAPASSPHAPGPATEADDGSR